MPQVNVRLTDENISIINTHREKLESHIFTEQMEGVSEEWDSQDVGCMHTENNPNQNYLQLRNKRGKGKK